MRVYFGKETGNDTRTHNQQVGRVEHKLFVDNFYSYPSLYEDLTNLKINCWGAVHPNCNGMSHNSGHKILKVKWSNTQP
jgi:hypothetical protein